MQSHRVITLEYTVCTVQCFIWRRLGGRCSYGGLFGGGVSGLFGSGVSGLFGGGGRA